MKIIRKINKNSNVFSFIINIRYTVKKNIVNMYKNKWTILTQGNQKAENLSKGGTCTY